MDILNKIINFKQSKEFYFFGLPLLLFFIIPGYFISLNSQYLKHIDLILLIIIFSFSYILLTFAFYFIFWLLNRPLKKYFICLTEFFFHFILFAGLLFPTSKSMEMIDATVIFVDQINFLVVFILSSFILLLSHSRFIKILNIFLLSFCVVMIINAFYGFLLLYSPSSSTQNKSIFKLGSSKNIFVISFDGIPREVLLDLIKSKQGFDDFVAYKNVISSSPDTLGSTLASLYGNHDFKKLNKDHILLNDVDLLTNFLPNHGFNVSTYGPYSIGFKNQTNTFFHKGLKEYKSPIISKFSDIIDFYHNIIARIGAKYALNEFIKIKRFINGLLTKFFSFPNIEKLYFPNNTFVELVDFQFDKTYVLTKFDYDAYLENIKISNKKNVAHFLHFSYTHFPVRFDSNCQYRGGDKVWFYNHQNENGVKGEVNCALKGMQKFILKLKALNIYDKSLIVFKSDHGKPGWYYKPNKYNFFKIREHRLWGYDRYTPFLLIKNFNRRAKCLTSNKEPVMLDDLAKTLCLAAAPKESCERYNGFNLLSKNLHIPKSADSFIFIVKDKSSTFRFNTHETLHLKRRKNFHENIHQALVQELFIEDLDCSANIDFFQSKVFNNGRSNYKSWATWEIDQSYFIAFKNNNCKKELIIRLASCNKDKLINSIDIFLNGNLVPFNIKTFSKINVSDHKACHISISPKHLLGPKVKTIKVQSLLKDPKLKLHFTGMRYE